VSPEPYLALVAIAEREHAVALSGERFDELAAIAGERAALVAALPAQAPASARPALERAAGLQLATTAALRAALDRTRAELAGSQTRGQAVRAYTRAA
jgi:hypothetical protein